MIAVARAREAGPDLQMIGPDPGGRPRPCRAAAVLDLDHQALRAGGKEADLGAAAGIGLAIDEGPALPRSPSRRPAQPPRTVPSGTSTGVRRILSRDWASGRRRRRRSPAWPARSIPFCITSQPPSSPVPGLGRARRWQGSGCPSRTDPPWWTSTEIGIGAAKAAARRRAASVCGATAGSSPSSPSGRSTRRPGNG